MSTDNEWVEFIRAHPQFAGSQPHEPDPENRVWPIFAEWRTRRVRQALDDLLAVSGPGAEAETRLNFRLRTGGVDQND